MSRPSPHELAVLLAAVPVVVLGVLGVMKLLAVPFMRAAAGHLGFDVRTYRVIGALEIAGSAGLVVGLSRPGIGLLAGFCLVALLSGAWVAHAQRGDGVRRRLPAVGVAALVLGYCAAILGEQ